MHIYILISLIGLILPDSGSGDGINFEHKRIGKEVQKVYQLTDYDLSELGSLRSTALNGEILGKYFKVESESGGNYYIYIGRVFTCPQGGCDETINSSVTTEYFDYILMLDNDNHVRKVTVLNYQATHGQEVCSKGWLKQFIGSGSKSVLKPGKNIDAISGATKSVGAIVKDISLRLKEIDAYLS